VTTVAIQYAKKSVDDEIVDTHSLRPFTKPDEIKIGLLTGGFDRPYAFGITMSLAAKSISVDVLGGAEVDSPEMHTTPRVHFLDTYGDPRKVSGLGKATRVLRYYLRILKYAVSTKAKILHLLWNNKLPFFDRTLLMFFYKMLGKKVVFTAHNVNAGKRDGNDSWHNQLGLKTQYRLADHIFVHTEKMKSELFRNTVFDRMRSQSYRLASTILSPTLSLLPRKLNAVWVSEAANKPYFSSGRYALTKGSNIWLLHSSALLPKTQNIG